VKSGWPAKGLAPANFQKSRRELADNNIVPVASLCSVKGRAMFARLRKTKLAFSPQLFAIRWYPSNKNCVNSKRPRPKPQQMPPLMVRKPAWRQ
jgi:hypothetical protein